MTHYRLPLTLVLAVGVATNASGYDKAGHYYSVATTVRSLIPELGEAEADIVAFCSQLPDESIEIDATQVYRQTVLAEPGAWLRWAWSDEVGSNEVRRMITVQQLLHGLTGGSASALSQAARGTLCELAGQVRSTPGDRNLLCALGFAYHLWGDSFAHRRLAEHESMEMYPTGMGHAADLHYPDYPFYEGRGLLSRGWDVIGRLFPGLSQPVPHHREIAWRDHYVAGGPDCGDSWKVEPHLAHQMSDQFGGFAEEARRLPEYGEYEIRKRLWTRMIGKTAADPAATPPLSYGQLDQHKYKRCQAVVGEFFESRCDPLFFCHEAWRKFESVARSQFESHPEARDTLGGRLVYPAVYLAPEFLAPSRVGCSPQSLDFACADGQTCCDRCAAADDNCCPVGQKCCRHAQVESPPAGLQPSMAETCKFVADLRFKTNDPYLTDLDKVALQKSSEEILQRLNESSSLRLGIRGHADRRGSSEHNNSLASRRARNTLAAILDQVSSSSLKDLIRSRADLMWSGSLSPQCPLESETDDNREECLQQNRHVQVVLQDECGLPGRRVQDRQ